MAEESDALPPGLSVRKRLQTPHFLDPEGRRRKSFTTRPRYTKAPETGLFG
jgi:hypothetical protein